MLPQITMIIILCIGFGISLANHGKPRSEENAFIVFVSTVITLAILYWGGFFDCLIK
jgi:hypothetical protein